MNLNILNMYMFRHVSSASILPSHDESSTILPYTICTLIIEGDFSEKMNVSEHFRYKAEEYRQAFQTSCSCR